jgi:putative transposase
VQAARTASRVADLIDRDHPALSLRRQCDLLGVARSTLDYEPVPQPEEEIRLRRILDELYLEDPCLGLRRLPTVLDREHGLIVNRKRLRRIRSEMGLETIYCRPRTSIPASGHRIFPYLLREMKIERPDQVWCADITYVPMARGNAYLCAVMDWHSRKVLGWSLSNTMDTGLCLAALEQALAASGGRLPEIFNTDQGSQFTSEAWLGRLEQLEIRISMDGKGRWMDNVFIERLWRSVKYEEIYINGCADLLAQDRALERWFRRYNEWRPHQTLENRTPSSVYGAAEKIVEMEEKRVA